MSYFSYSKRFKGVADVFLRSPQTYRPLLEFIEGVMLGPSELSKEQREILAAHVSLLNGCDFCVQAHIATLAALGASDKVLNALEQNEASTLGDSSFQRLLEFAEKLTRTPHAVAQQDIDVLTGAGLSEQLIEDAVNVVSLFNYVNRLVDAFGVQGNPGYFQAVGRSLAQKGYAGLLPARTDTEQEKLT